AEMITGALPRSRLLRPFGARRGQPISPGGIMHRLLNTLLARLLIGTGIPLVLFLAVALVATIAIQRLNAGLWWEQHTHQVIEDALRLEQNLNTMRLARRGLALLNPDSLR